MNLGDSVKVKYGSLEDRIVLLIEPRDYVTTTSRNSTEEQIPINQLNLN